jgi:hypothetical protein
MIEPERYGMHPLRHRWCIRWWRYESGFVRLSLFAWSFTWRDVRKSHVPYSHRTGGARLLLNDVYHFRLGRR